MAEPQPSATEGPDRIRGTRDTSAARHQRSPMKCQAAATLTAARQIRISPVLVLDGEHVHGPGERLARRAVVVALSLKVPGAVLACWFSHK